jgi:hypothetical protein
MIRMRIGMSLLSLSLVLATPGLAQMQGMPVYFSPKGGTGITLDGDFGRISSSKRGTQSDVAHPTAIGGRAYLGVPFITVGVGVAVYDPNVVGQKNSTEYMGSAAFKVLGGPLVPLAVTLQAGAGYRKEGSGALATKSVSVPIGLGFALNIPTPGASLEPWAAARLQVNAETAGTGVTSASGTRLGYGLSGGISLGLPIGLGAHVGVDYASYAARATSLLSFQRSKLQTLTVGAGLHFMIRMPGLPGVPIVPGV